MKLPDGFVVEDDLPPGFVPEEVDWSKRFLRNAGLQTRAGIEGLAGAADFLGPNIVNPFFDALGVDAHWTSGEEGGRWLANQVGLPSPANEAEQTSSNLTKTIAGVGAGIKSGQAVEDGVSTVGNILKSFADDGTAQLAAGSAASLTADTFKDDMPGWATILTSLAAGGAAFKGTQAVQKRLQAMDYDELAQNVMKGFDFGQMSKDQIKQFTADVAKSIKNGEPLNRAAMDRLALYGRLGLTPTRARMTLDPVDVTQEANLAKLGANSADPNMQRLAQVSNQNNATLLQNLDEYAPGVDPYQSGQQVISQIDDRLAASADAVSRAYREVRDNAGRGATLDRAWFAEEVNRRLQSQMLLHSIPADVRNLINDIAYGKVKFNGDEIDMPFTTDQVVALDQMLSGAMKNGGNEAAAAGIIRDVLFETPVAEQGSDVLQIYQRAREMARDNFKFRESSGSVKAVADGKASPDNFIDRQFIKAPTDQAAAFINQLDDAGRATVRGVVGDFLKKAATGGNPNELANFRADGFRKALSSISPQKLAMLFTPEEIQRLRDLAEAAKIEVFQPRGSAVNNSNTSPALIKGLYAVLDRLPNVPLVTSTAKAAVGGSEAVLNAAQNNRAARDAMRLPSAGMPQTGRPGSSPLMAPLLFPDYEDVAP